MNKFLTTLITILMLVGAGYAARFTDNLDGTITDNQTGLMWMKNVNVAGTTMDWTNAVNFCLDLTTNGYSDWRLPTVNDAPTYLAKELETLGWSNGIPYGTWEGFDGTPFTNFPAYPADYWANVSFGGDATEDAGYLIQNLPGPSWAMGAMPKLLSWYVLPVRGPVAPVKPVNLVPTNNATGQAKNTIIAWQYDVSAIGYRINFGLSGALGYISNTVATNYTPTLTYGATYQWRIDATNVFSTTQGDVWSFTVTTAPPIVIIVSGTDIGHISGAAVGNVKGRAQ